ncbi:MAG: hypothetical protein JST04_15005 [Bdellovibrionales bacterium]|nr:hypothetical protein [Bdellovibrionales bacterium]
MKDQTKRGVDPRWLVGKWFFFYRAVFYVAVAFLVRESVVPARSSPRVETAYAGERLDQSLLSSEFTRWSATFPSRLDRAMETGVAE